MGPGLPAVSGRLVVASLCRAGFRVIRISGSHHMLEHPGPPLVQLTVPVHGSRTLPPGTFRAIVRKSGLDVDAFRDLLR